MFMAIPSQVVSPEGNVVTVECSCVRCAVRTVLMPEPATFGASNARKLGGASAEACCDSPNQPAI